jgi:hypothetical protein
MEMSKKVIDIELYNVLEKMERKDRKVIIKSFIPDAIKVGYGLYDYGIAKNEGRPFIWYSHGSSCD